MTTGTVTWFDADKGFGFLTPDDGGPDIFVHFSAIEVDGYRVLEQGQRIEYDVRDGDRGPQAQHVRPLDPDAEPAGRDHGVVSWFDADKGFGFLTPDAGGADLFVHFSEIAADGYRTLEPGQHVEYDVKQSDRGPQAAQVLPVDADAPDQRAPERSSAPRQDGEVVMTGVLSWLAGDKGYGFLTPDDLFVHVSALGDVAEGDRVAFVVRQGERGPQAEHVVPLGEAAGAPNPVPQVVRDARLQELLALLREQQGAFNLATLGQALPVLFTGPGRRPGQMSGRTPYLQPVHIDGSTALIGTERMVTIQHASPTSLSGTLSSEAICA